VTIECFMTLQGTTQPRGGEKLMDGTGTQFLNIVDYQHRSPV